MTIAELRARLEEIRARLEELREAATTRSLNDDETGEIDSLLAEFDEKRTQLVAAEERATRLAAVADVDLGDAERSERGSDEPDDRGTFRTNAGSRVPRDVYDLDAYRTTARTEDDQRALLRDGALKAVDRAVFPHPNVKREDAQEHVERLLETVHGDPARLAQMILSTGSPEYRTAFGKALAGRNLTNDESRLLERAASLADAGGGVAVPFVLDPTVILTSSGAVNPYRSIARIVTTTADNWNGVTSAGITASYDAEAAEVSDDTPTFAQPSVTVEKAQSLIPFSIEIGMDWNGFAAEMAAELADAKDVLEESKFTTGAGHGSTEPEGIITGATVTVSTATTAVFALADVYSVQEALPARWEGNASWLMHKKVGNKIKALAQALSSGDVGTWVDLAATRGASLNGDPVYRATTISSAYTTTNAKILVLGDFRQFVIVDRVGMSVELIPHLFATANNLPSGQRGIYCYWRNSSKVLVPSAFRVLKVL